MRSPAPTANRLFLAAVLLVLLLPAWGVSAQEAGEGSVEPTQAIPEERSSPRAAMFTFLDAMNAIKRGDKVRWYEVFGVLGEPSPTAKEAHVLQRRAVKLLESLDYIGQVEASELPGPTNSPAKFHVYFPQPFNGVHDRAVRDIGRDDLVIAFAFNEELGWAFSEDTFEALNELHTLLLENRTRQFEEQINSEVRDVLVDWIPDALKQDKLFGLLYWQWIALALLILLGVMIDQATRAFLRVLLTSRLAKAGREVEPEQIVRAARPFGFVIGGVLVMLGLTVLGLPDLAYRFLYGAAAVFTVLSGILAAWQLIDLVIAIVLEQVQKTKTKFDDILVPMFGKAAKIFAVAIGIIYGAQALNLPIVPLIGSLGIGSLAFAFAAKDTIENFFGSVAVILDKPFEVGDWVVIDGSTEGTVEELGFRSTRIRTFYNSQITVPNSTLVRATVDNYGRRKYRRWKTHVGVQYDTPPDKLIAFTEGIRELVRQHPYTRKDYYQVWMHQWSSSSMDVLLYIFFEVPDWSTELRERERMFVDIVRLADSLGVQFAFPTQTVHLYKEEHADYQTKHETPGNSTDRRSLVQGIRAARELVSNQPWLDDPPGAVSYSFEGVEIDLDEAGNETLLDKEDKTEPSGDEPEPSDEDQTPKPDTQ
ncbi:MAG: mechanosensitive ion channel family protein [Planctomycetota bacterium]